MPTPLALARRRLAAAPAAWRRWSWRCWSWARKESTMLDQAIAIYKKYNRLTDPDRATIERLVTEAGPRFDLKRWALICRSQRRRGRADLAAAEYRRLGRQVRATRPAVDLVDRAAYATLQAESAAAERERRASMERLLNSTSEIPRLR